MTRLRATYDFDLVPRRHRLTPGISVTEFDRDGAAMSADRTAFDLTYLYNSPKVTVGANLLIAEDDFDAVHPIYGVEREEDQVGLVVQVLIRGLFPNPRLALRPLLAYYDNNANIDFYDSEVSIVGLTVFYSF